MSNSMIYSIDERTNQDCMLAFLKHLKRRVDDISQIVLVFDNSKYPIGLLHTWLGFDNHCWSECLYDLRSLV